MPYCTVRLYLTSESAFKQPVGLLLAYSAAKCMLTAVSMLHNFSIFLSLISDKTVHYIVNSEMFHPHCVYK